MSGWFFRLWSWRGALVRLHVLVPVGAVIYLAFGRSVWQVLAILGLILVHELGHAVLVRRYRAQVVAIDLLPWGGECSWSGEVSALERAFIAWGGVLAQALVLAAVVVAQVVLGPPRSRVWFELAYALTWSNAWMIGFNLLPVPPLDGSRAWKALPLWWRTRRAEAKRARQREVLARLDQLRDLDEKEVPREVREAVDKALEDARRK